jgi:hypothetical protein
MLEFKGGKCAKCFKIQGPYSKHFIFSVTYEWPNKQVLQYTGLESLASYKHPIIMGSILSLEETKSVVNTAPLGYVIT